MHALNANNPMKISDIKRKLNTLNINYGNMWNLYV